MIGIDTNVLIRFFLADDSVQAQLATEFLETGLSAREPGFVSIVTMVETVWVLQRVFKLRQEEIFSIVERLLRTDVLLIQSKDEVERAASFVRAGQGSFSDLLIRELSTTAGCSTTMTFDRKASKLPGFTLLEP